MKWKGLGHRRKPTQAWEGLKVIGVGGGGRNVLETGSIGCHAILLVDSWPGTSGLG